MQLAAVSGISQEDLIKGQLQSQMGCAPESVIVRTVDVGTVHRGGQAQKEIICFAMTRDTVMDEDYAVLKTTRPRQAAAPTEELLVEADRTLAQVRKMTLDYGQQAGMIDVPAWQALADTHIRVIPCPGHKAE